MVYYLMLLFLICGFTISQAQGAEIATIDMQRAVQSTEAGKQARAQWEKEFSKMKADVEKKETALKATQEDLEHKKSVMTEVAFAKKQDEFQEEIMKFRETVAKNQEEIQKRERDLTLPILEKMKRAIQRIAQEKSYAVVLESSPMIAYADKRYDITDQAIAAFAKEK